MDDYLLAAKLSAKLLKYESCSAFMNDTMAGLTQNQLQILCNQTDFSNYTTVTELSHVCEFEYSEEWVEFMKRPSLSDLQMAQLCDRENPSLGQLLATSRK